MNHSAEAQGSRLTLSLSDPSSSIVYNGSASRDSCSDAPTASGAHTASRSPYLLSRMRSRMLVSHTSQHCRAPVHCLWIAPHATYITLPAMDGAGNLLVNR
jgi:hypothetical protein